MKTTGLVNYSDTSTGQTGGRVVKDTGWGTDHCIRVLHPKQVTVTQANTHNLTKRPFSFSAKKAIVHMK